MLPWTVRIPLAAAAAARRCVEFHSVKFNIRIAGQRQKRRSCTRAGINCSRLSRELEMRPQPQGVARRQRVVPHLETGSVACHRGSLKRIYQVE